MKHKEIWRMLFATVGVGLILPLMIIYLMNQNLGAAPGLVLIGMVCLGWPGYSIWLSIWACKDIRYRWFLPILFHLMLAYAFGFLPGIFGILGLFACGAMLLISIIVMFVTVSSGTKE